MIENEVSADEFRELFERVSNWGRWGPTTSWVRSIT